ncbi:MAG: family 16 glycosylhydrolase [Bacillota bacterium]
MKNLFSLSIFLILIVTLAACEDDNDPNNNNKEPYDERGIVSEDCEGEPNIDDWQPVWCSEFDEDGLPSNDYWGYDVGGHGWGNNELQYYTDDDLDNAYIEDGILNIQALREEHEGNDYTSARLVSKYRGDWEYARIQVRAKMPSGRGTWPAIWMLPSEWRYGDWPHSGEIDIMEYVGYDPGVVHGTIHTGAYNHGLGTQIGYSKDVPDAEDAFHLYEMIWEPGKIVLMIDGEEFAQFGFNPDANIGTENSEAWPFDQPFHLILNVAVGGDWGGAQGVDSNAFPTKMEVDYVRVFQKDYAGMSEEAPSEPSDVEMAARSNESVRLHWDKSTHDVAVHEYDIFVDNTLVGSTTLNAFDIEGLDPGTSYEVGIVAKDFADNKSEMVTHTVQTSD